MKTLSKDARGFVDSVVKYIQKDKLAGESVEKDVRHLLNRVSEADLRANQAIVETAVNLTAAETTTINQIIEKLVGHPITLVNQVKPAIIGGLRITIGDWILDSSLIYQLDQLKSILI
jgi:F0F1-type ATP synthase delta subunit